MQFSIWFSGPAGSGVNTSWLLLWELLSQKWYHVLIDKEYASVIKWDNNLIVVYVSDQKNFISKKIDYFIAFDDYAIKKNQEIYELKNIVNLKTCPCKYKNTPAFGFVLKLLWVELTKWEEMLKKYFDWEKLTDNIEFLHQGYNIDLTDYDIQKFPHEITQIAPSKMLFYGNEIIAKWAIESWLDRYSAYPMTPASSIIDEVVKDPKVTFFQWEDEISVAMSMLWAKFAGKRAACGTSGWWFALMSESISFSNQAELWWVYILSQRDGPSTGTPTFTGQSDLTYALNASFGDTFPIVIAPSNFEDGYQLIGKALNWSDQYQHPVIVLLDKQYSESYLSVDMTKLHAEPINRWKLLSEKDISEDNFKRYEFTKDGISPWSIPGFVNGEFITTSYEHDEYGATNENPLIKKDMQDKRDQKLKTFVEKEFNKDFYGYEIINPKAEKFFITYGFNRLAIENYIQDKANLWLIVITVFQPIDPRLKVFLEENNKQIQSLVFVEMNVSGQLQRLITEQCHLNKDIWKDKIKNIRKYDLYPIFQEIVQNN